MKKTMESYLAYAEKFTEYSIEFMNLMVGEYEDGELTEDEVRDFFKEYIAKTLKRQESTNARFIEAFNDIIQDVVKEAYCE